MDFVVELARPDDASAIAGIVVRSTGDAYAGLLSENYNTGLSVDRLRSNYLRGISRGDEYWVARHDEQLVGMARATGPRETNPPRSRELTMIYVEAAFRGSGVAQQLLDASVGDIPCLLWVGAQNHHAQAFYRRNGFVADGAEKRVPVLENLLGIRMVR